MLLRLPSVDVVVVDVLLVLVVLLVELVVLETRVVPSLTLGMLLQLLNASFHPLSAAGVFAQSEELLAVYGASSAGRKFAAAVESGATAAGTPASMSTSQVFAK
jgi:hypothetical protein